MEQLNDKVVDFLFEAGMLARTPRSYFNLLGNGKQSVAEHINRVCYLGFVLAKMAKEVDEFAILKMCLFHDFTEARISDLNYVHQKYTSRDEQKALEDLTVELPFGGEIKNVIKTYKQLENKEALLVKDADNLELLLSLKEQLDFGNEKAKSWIQVVLGRLGTKEGKLLAEKIVQTDSDHWWFADKADQWWVTRNKE